MQLKVNINLISSLVVIAATVVASRGAAQRSNDALRAAIEDMERTDARGQFFSFSLATAGVLPGLVMGSIALADPSLLALESADPLQQTASIAALATGSGLIVHGIMRIVERRANALHARDLLRDESALNAAGRPFLRARGYHARQTRLWGGVLTSLHGASLTLMGVAALIDERDANAAGYVLLSLGVLTVAVGAVHFFGDTHPERLYDGLAAQWRVAPTLQLGPGGGATGVQAQGTF
ncbi:MAG: hypothetical protein AAF938_07830 [Myxococcota bacterium]